MTSPTAETLKPGMSDTKLTEAAYQAVADAKVLCDRFIDTMRGCTHGQINCHCFAVAVAAIKGRIPESAKSLNAWPTLTLAGIDIQADTSIPQGAAVFRDIDDKLVVAIVNLPAPARCRCWDDPYWNCHEHKDGCVALAKMTGSDSIPADLLSELEDHHRQYIREAAEEYGCAPATYLRGCVEAAMAQHRESDPEADRAAVEKK